MSVDDQERELKRLEAMGRVRSLTDAETARLSELIRLERQRNYSRRRRLPAQRERAIARLCRIAVQSEALNIT